MPLVNSTPSSIDLSPTNRVDPLNDVSNDPENVEPKIPDYYLANIKLKHSKGPMSFLIGVNNLLDEEYYDFAVASTFHDDDHFGLRGVYPLAKRTVYMNLSYEF